MSKRPKANRNKAKDVEIKPTPPIAMPRSRQPDHRQALQFLDGVVAMAPVSRQAHIQVQQALQQLGGAITELEISRKEKSNDKK